MSIETVREITLSIGSQSFQIPLDATLFGYIFSSYMFVIGIAFSVGLYLGKKSSYSDGYEVGKNDGKDIGYTQGYKDGIELGNSQGYHQGKRDGYDDGYSKGFTDGNERGIKKGYKSGYELGRPSEFSNVKCQHYPSNTNIALLYDIEITKRDNIVIEVSCPFIKGIRCINTNTKCVFLDNQ